MMTDRNARYGRRCIAPLALLAACCGSSAAQAADDADPVPSYGSVVKDTTEAPGFDALAKSGSDISYPGSVQKIGIGLLNAIDQQGNFNTGLALQFSPYLLTHQKNLSRKQYMRDQVWARFNLTAATAKAAESSKGLYASLGASWMPIAQDDPYGSTTIVTCVASVVDANNGPPRDVQSGSFPANPADLKTVGDCLDEFAAKPKINLLVGAAAIFFSPDGTTSKLRQKGYYASGTLHYSLPKAGIGLLASASYRRDEAVPDPATKGAYLDRNRLSLGGRFIYGNGKTYAVGMEAAYQRANYTTGIRDNYVTYVAAVDVKLLDSFWGNFKLGGSSGHRADGHPAFFGTSLTWGAKPDIGPPPGAVDGTNAKGGPK